MTNYEIAMHSDAREIVKKLTSEYVERSGKIYIRCPIHEERVGSIDHHIGNCVVRDTGCYCYSCGGFVKTADLIRRLQPGVEDAYKFMADFYGYEQDNVSDSKSSGSFFCDERALKSAGYRGNIPETREEYKHIVSELVSKLDQLAEKCRNYDTELMKTCMALLGDDYDVTVLEEITREIKIRKARLER